MAWAGERADKSSGSGSPRRGGDSAKVGRKLEKWRPASVAACFGRHGYEHRAAVAGCDSANPGRIPTRIAANDDRRFAGRGDRTGQDLAGKRAQRIHLLDDAVVGGESD